MHMLGAACKIGLVLVSFLLLARYISLLLLWFMRVVSFLLLPRVVLFLLLPRVVSFLLLFLRADSFLLLPGSGYIPPVRHWFHSSFSPLEWFHPSSA